VNEDRFIEIVEAVEALGGELLPETHVGVEIPYEIKGTHGRKTKKPLATTGCGAEALVEIPYAPAIARDPSNPKKILDLPEGQRLDPVPARFCILDDMMYLWPRFNQDPA
jgi:hypothetical protein